MSNLVFTMMKTGHKCLFIGTVAKVDFQEVAGMLSVINVVRLVIYERIVEIVHQATVVERARAKVRVVSLVEIEVQVVLVIDLIAQDVVEAIVGEVIILVEEEAEVVIREGEIIEEEMTARGVIRRISIETERKRRMIVQGLRVEMIQRTTSRRIY